MLSFCHDNDIINVTMVEIDMTDSYYGKIKKYIEELPEGEVFFTTDLIDVASLTTIRKCLGRLVSEGCIRRIFDGTYEKPKYSKVIGDFLSINPEKVAYALARKYHWTISPCGDIALNKMGLSTQVPVVWSYVSDGPYRKYNWDKTVITFKHKTNREISFMSEISMLVVEAIKTLGKERVDENSINHLKRIISRKDKDIILRETADVASWIYDYIREICA